LGRSNRGDRLEAGEVVGEEVAVAGSLLAEAVLQLDLDGARSCRRGAHARGSSEAVPVLARWGMVEAAAEEASASAISSAWVSMVPRRPSSSSVRRHT